MFAIQTLENVFGKSCLGRRCVFDCNLLSSQKSHRCLSKDEYTFQFRAQWVLSPGQSVSVDLGVDYLLDFVNLSLQLSPRPDRTVPKLTFASTQTLTKSILPNEMYTNPVSSQGH